MINANRILECVAEKHGVTIVEIIGRSRVKKNNEARFFFCLIARELTRITYREIGDYTGRSHCTVIHSIKRAKELIETYPEMKILYKRIKDEITVE